MSAPQPQKPPASADTGDGYDACDATPVSSRFLEPQALEGKPVIHAPEGAS